MKTIKIIGGTYGHRENGRVVPKTSSDDPFAVDDKAAERLVSLGVAELAEAAAAAGPAQAAASEDTDPLESMTVPELQELAVTVGLEKKDTKKLRKDDLIAAIKAAQDTDYDKDSDTEGEDEADGDDEKPPELSPSAPV